MSAAARVVLALAKKRARKRAKDRAGFMFAKTIRDALWSRGPEQLQASDIQNRVTLITQAHGLNR